MSTAAIVLAAGPSTRLGRTKQLEEWGGTNLLGHVVALVHELPVDEVWVVLGHDSERILAETDLGEAAIIENPEWEEGVASSLRVALDAVTRLSRCDRALIMNGDQPDLPGDLVAELTASHAKAGKPVSIPRYRYQLGGPVLVERSLWPRLMSMEGDDDVMRLFKAHPEWVNEVRFSENPPRTVEREIDITELRPRPVV